MSCDFRRQMLRKRMSKGPLKIILNAGDLVFPDLPAHRGVSFFLEQFCLLGKSVALDSKAVPSRPMLTGIGTLGLQGKSFTV